MQIDQLKEDGLKRQFKVVYAAEEVDAKVSEKLTEVGAKIRMPGFRPGKAPLSLLKKLHGQAVLGEVLDQLVQEGSNALLSEKALKPALKPNVEILSFSEGAALEFRLDIEILPDVQVPDFSKIKLERLVTAPADEEVEAALDKIAAQHKRFEDAAPDHKAVLGEVVVIDFDGKIDGTAFEGGAGEGHALELGSGSFIPGFEEQLVDITAGAETVVHVNFPADYHASELAGKAAEFAVKVKSVRTLAKTAVDDTLAQELGLSDLDALKDKLRDQVGQDSAMMSRSILKRRLLDALAELVDFPIPEGMAEIEYKQIWEQIKLDAINSGEADAESLKDVDEPIDKKERIEFRNIAERRVRLGLLLSEVGSQNDVQVTAEEVNRHLLAEAQRFPGQEKEVFDYYQKNENAMATLRAPIFEEKVCDLILDAAAITERSVTRAELEAAVKDLEEMDDASAVKKPPKKAKAGKKPKASETGHAGKLAKGGKSGPTKPKSKAKSKPKGKAKSAKK